MKTVTGLSLAAMVVLSSVNARLSIALAGTTIDAVNRYGWGANIGWTDWRGDVNHGAVIGEYVCSGYIYAANVGWISLGSGAPADGIRYQNSAGNDFGVNRDRYGNLRGYAYGANIGWINFEHNGAAKVNLTTGQFSGYAWSANCGWLSLSNAQAFVETDSIRPGTDSDGDGIADAWELLEFRNLTTANATSDSDGDHMSDLEEYWADTGPRDPTDNLRITSIQRGMPGDPTYVILVWTTRPTRLYALERSTEVMTPPPWPQYVTGFENLLGWNNVGFNDFAPNRFYRIRAVRPLMP